MVHQAAQRRKNKAHGVSRGYEPDRASPEAAKDGLLPVAKSRCRNGTFTQLPQVSVHSKERIDSGADRGYSRGV